MIENMADPFDPSASRKLADELLDAPLELEASATPEPEKQRSRNVSQLMNLMGGGRRFGG